MEAIIRDSGRQFKVAEGQTIDIDYRDAEPGSEVEFGDWGGTHRKGDLVNLFISPH